ncbi:M56 family metallopeptidase [Roseivirga sp.]|uniref:M56 family metallopeptidase n=1 Tax=Roseivirga sp. TaxID=1964215 RepID=UPI003B8E78F4
MIVYLIKFIICSGILLLFYHLGLQKDRLFKFNRFYLLAILFLSLIIPVTTVRTHYVEVPRDEFIETTDYSSQIAEASSLPYQAITPLNEETSARFDISSNDLLWAGYLLIAGLFLLRFSRNIVAILWLKRGSYIKPAHGIKIALRSDVSTSFSFLNCMFTNKERFEQGNLPLEIIEHEKFHIKDRHSIDIILIELLQCAFWFNPMVYFIKKAIKLNHEFLADAYVINQKTSAYDYQKILLEYTEKQMLNAPAFASNLNYGFTKKRLNMMTKNTNKMLSLIKPVAAGLIIFGSFMALGVTDTVAKIVETPTLEIVQDGKKVQKDKVDNSDKAEIKVDLKTNVEVEQEKDIKYKKILKPLLINLDVKDTIGHFESIQLVPTKAKVSFKNDIGETIEKVYNKLTDEEKKQFWKAGSGGKYFMEPTPKKSISQSELNEFLDEKVYGVWLDNKKIKNAELKNFTPKDFHHFTKSRLLGRAKVSKDYSFQVNLTTNIGFENGNNTNGSWVNIKASANKMALATLPIQDEKDEQRLPAPPFLVKLVRYKGANGKIIAKNFTELTKEERKVFFKKGSNPEYFRPAPVKMKIDQSLLNEFLDTKKYRIWLDGKQIENEDLKKYRLEDLHHYLKSKLGKNARNFGKYDYQLDISTVKSVKPEGEWLTFNYPHYIQLNDEKEVKKILPEIIEVKAKEKKGGNL